MSRRKIMNPGIRDIFDVFMLMSLITILAFEWLDFAPDGWRRIAVAVLVSALGSVMGGAIYKKIGRIRQDG
ncbi:hypothetical protein G6L37_01595 [Agrobacterium rubi]|nr:hypothetical protein [Agrobacterium rubi]NTF24087.1 hypothetical protein [Agrobacterium rubi]